MKNILLLALAAVLTCCAPPSDLEVLHRVQLAYPHDQVLLLSDPRTANNRFVVRTRCGAVLCVQYLYDEAVPIVEAELFPCLVPEIGAK